MVYQQIKDAIYSAVLLPGEAIKEWEEGQSVSQSTVRQALIQLEHAHLVERFRNRKTLVVNLDQRTIANLIDVRVPLEVLACESASRHLSDADTLALAEQKLRQIGQSPGTDEAFHHFIWDLADNDLLRRTLKILCSPMFAFVTLLRQKGLQRVTERVRSHRAFLDAILREGPDPTRAAIEYAVRQHVQDAYACFQRSGLKDLKELSRCPDVDPSEQPSAQLGGASKHREFLRWMPATAVIIDSDLRVVYVNEEFERWAGKTLEELQGRPFSDRLWKQVNEIVACERTGVLVVERRQSRARMTLCFPLSVNGAHVFVAELGIDITSMLSIVSSSWVAEKPVQSISPAYNAASEARTPPEALRAFFEDLPAVATWKDRVGRMLWANPAFKEVTGKSPSEVVGHSPTENWPGPVGESIARHDARVRDRREPYLTMDRFIFEQSEKCRLTIRFPLFDESLQLEGTATLGFDHRLLELSRDMLAELHEGDADFRRVPMRP